MRSWLFWSLVGVAGLVAAAVLAVGGAVGYLASRSARPVVLPPPTGPYAVGRTIVDWTDRARRDPFSPGGRGPRVLSVWVWYPARPARGARPAPYLPPLWAAATGASSGLQPLVRTAPSRIAAQAVEDAPLAQGGSGWPLLVFDPGLGLGAADYTTLADDLASHGYIVAAINPTYSTDVVLHGRIVHSVFAARDGANPSRLTRLWSGDILFVADQMEARNGTMFSGHVRTGRVGFFGHSLGGAAATQACRLDPQCVGAVDIDGDLFGSVVSTGLGKPFLFLGDGESLNQSTVSPASVLRTSSATLSTALSGVLRGVPAGDGHVLTVTGTGHFSFTDRAAYFWAFRGLKRLGAQGGTRVIAVTRTYVRAFFDTYLLERPSPLLSGRSPDFPNVRYHAVRPA